MNGSLGRAVYTGITKFFYFYDFRFAACDSPGSIDYPLSYDKMDLSGIEYIYEYLSHLKLENKFCSRFSPNDIEGLMRGHSKYYKEDLLNVYELVLTNLLGRSLLGYKPDKLDITGADRKCLGMRLENLSNEELEEQLDKEFNKIAMYMGISDASEKDYLKRAVKNISHRLEQNVILGKLDKIFISLKNTYYL